MNRPIWACFSFNTFVRRRVRGRSAPWLMLITRCCRDTRNATPMKHPILHEEISLLTIVAATFLGAALALSLIPESVFVFKGAARNAN